MTAMDQSLIGAPPSAMTWNSINWKTIEKQVRRLQIRIAKAVSEGRQGKVKALQWLLTHSFSAKLSAVNRVVKNKGRNTPGVDKIIWKTPQQKLAAAQSLKRKGYKTLPLKRIYIPKKDGRKRSLSIPCMKCRAMQALYLLALEPISEFYANKNSYGFRPKRSCADAIVGCYIALAKRNSAQWVLEADIKSCFDKISHEWLRNNIPMDKEILNKWLAAGYVDENVTHRTEEGAPQGGIASPTLLNLTLSGLEETVTRATKRKDKVHFSIYADDFIITGSTKEVLEQKVKPLVESFLRERGLELSQEKTKITHIDDGFDFLSTNIRKYKGKYISKPSKKSVQTFLKDIRETIKSNSTAKTENLIHLLNPKIRGWANYHRYSCAKKAFSYIDYCIYKALWQWILRRHPNKNGKWLRKKYFRSHKSRNWVFTARMTTNTAAAQSHTDLLAVSSLAIKRHIKIKADATPFDPRYVKYFVERESLSDMACGVR